MGIALPFLPMFGYLRYLNVNTLTYQENRNEKLPK
jgi:hypothetical protein